MTRAHRQIRYVGLVVALLQLLGCATSPAPEAPAEPPAPPEQAAPQTAELPPSPQAPDKSAMRISIASVGDMMIGTDYPRNHLPDDDGVGFLADVAPYLSSADLTFGNLEGVLLDGGEPGKKCSNPSACYLFRSPTRYAQHYRAAGFDVLSLANNHARDFGEEGRSSSMQAIAAAGMHHSGRVDDFASLEFNGIRVAVLAYAVTKNSNMMLDYDLAFETVARFSASHDIVVVSFHGGAEGTDVTHVPFAEEEYYGEPRGDVVWFARGVVDAGADLVIGHGPHVVRGMENYNGRLIAYSLGNFATYYGISVAGIKGIAPILTTTLDGNGVFVEGKIVSTIQLRPAGPSVDPRHRALDLIRGLSTADFGEPGLQFLSDGRILPTSRPPVKPHVLQVSDD
ncbi:MAG: CapA family protein [Gammaproteobacteria bacterium]|nr:CapA family protein [Gammaproteobacteria bacterium]MBU2676150.1 CapA family protein [Gammaproteobacteria bacterium]NNC57038.1 CapA family protein [Woeseiaceae bacterium]NNL49886.1 CapA family protein [Woeseiaceae bacterium]